MTTPAPAPDVPPRTREELWQRIRTTSRDEVVLTEMQRFGFWPKEEHQPTLPAELIRRRAKLEKELSALRTERARIADRDRMAKALRKERLAASKLKQKETKERRERERQERAAAWQTRRGREIVFAGPGVSGGLGRRTAEVELLRSQDLPALETAVDLAQFLEIPLAELRFLTFHREVSQVNHYKRFEIPKKRGGTRLISAPMPRLKAAQRQVLEKILNRVAVEPAAQGFCNGRSILSNARPHVGRAVVINFDLQDFFPSITFPRVKGVFHHLGYSEEVATLLALLTTEPEIDEVEIDEQTFFVHRGPRRLPQGSPASPAITNVLCRRLDRRLTGMAQKLGFTYSRYADDLSFSRPDKAPAALYQLLRRVKSIVEHENFRLHPEKTRVMHKGRRQEVTGLVVNNGLSVDRRELRRLRALLFQIDKDGLAGKNWHGVPGEKGGLFWSTVLGYGQFVRMVDPTKGTDLVARIRDLMTKTGHKLPARKVYPKKPPSWIKKPEIEAAPTASTDAGVGGLVKKWWEKLKFW